MRRPPLLPYEDWKDTLETLHRHAQIVGKIVLAATPLVNHFWNVGFRPSARGLRTPLCHAGEHFFDFEFDLVDHQLVLRRSDGPRRSLALVSRPIAHAYLDIMEMLDSIGVDLVIDDRPVEIPGDRLPFNQDRVHGAYDHHGAARFRRALHGGAELLEQFRARFVGKASPVLFFWGTFDLDAVRYSGRRAPASALPGGGRIMREAASHECISTGWWPGDARLPEPAFYSYTSPKPDGLEHAKIGPHGATWHAQLGEFVLPHAKARSDEDILEFFQSTYEAGAERAGWDRDELERGGVTSSASASEAPAPSRLRPSSPERHPEGA